MQLMRRPRTLSGAAPGRRATSVPALIQSFVPASSTIIAHALERLEAFFFRASLELCLLFLCIFVITGAGLSTEYGIPDYRSDGVYSGYRFLLAAADQKIPMAILNNGPTRADHLAEFRAHCWEVLTVIQPH